MALPAVVEKLPKPAHAGPKILVQATDILVLEAATLALALLLRLVAVGVAFTAAVGEARADTLRIGLTVSYFFKFHESKLCTFSSHVVPFIRYFTF